MPYWLQVVVALAAPSGVLVALIERTRRENNRDHAKNSELLQSIDRKVDHVSERMDDHIEFQLDKGRKRRSKLLTMKLSARRSPRLLREQPQPPSLQQCLMCRSSRRLRWQGLLRCGTGRVGLLRRG